jgi:hypothetical protein
MKVAANFLAKDLTYDVPERDLRIDRPRLPALPRRQFIISNIRRSAASSWAQGARRQARGPAGTGEHAAMPYRQWRADMLRRSYGA